MSQRALLQLRQQMLRTVEKLVKSAASDAGTLHDSRHRQGTGSKDLRSRAQQPFAVFRIALHTCQGAVVRPPTGRWKLDLTSH
jgi:hypothetical protein